MCGLAGILSSRDEPLRDPIARMARCLAHRGPDAEGLWTGLLGSGGLALGHRRLSIIDLSQEGSQPMALPDAPLRMVFNGELYNYRDLREELAARGHIFRTATDTEVVMRAWLEWGPDALPRFEGMFAFAIADDRDGTLALVRDPFGIKPLYVYEGDGRLLFASEVRSLLASGLVPRELDQEAIPGYLAYGSVRAPGTLVRSVRSLDPGSVSTAEGGRIRGSRRWWSLADAARERGPATADEVHHLVRRAVQLETVSDVPLGAFLSGGVDSSAIVGILSQSGSAPPTTVTLVFDEPMYSEGPQARAVAERFGTDHREIVVRAAEVAEILPQIPSIQDLPSVDGINVWLVSRAARQAGLTVALSGLGGDELLAGYGIFRAALKWEKARRLTGWTGGVGRGVAGALGPRLPSRHRKMLDAAFSVGSLGELQRLGRRLFAPDDLAALLGRPVLPETNDPAPAGLDALGAISVFETSRYMHDTLLRDADQMSMAHALEVRVPLLNPRLAAAAVAAPASIKLGEGPKPLLVDAVPGGLPREVTHREKGTFTLPFDVWMRGPLRDQIEASLADLPGLDPVAVRRLHDRFQSGESGVNWTRVWALADLGAWSRDRLRAPDALLV